MAGPVAVVTYPPKPEWPCAVAVRMDLHPVAESKPFMPMGINGLVMWLSLKHLCWPVLPYGSWQIAEPGRAMPWL